MDEDPHHLRVLIADEDQRRITEIADVISGLGHTVVARMLDVSEIAEATRRYNPNVAIVALDGHQSHALVLISAIVKQASCPAIVDLDTDDEAFVDRPRARHLRYVKHGEQPGLTRSTATPSSAAARRAAYWHDHRAGEGHPHGAPRDQSR